MFDNFSSILNLGIKTKKRKIKIKKTLKSLALLKVLFSLGYIKGFIVNINHIEVWLNPKMFSLRGIFLISKKGGRKYIKCKNIPSILSGVLLISTSKGILTSYEAFSRKLGGEILYYIC